MKEIFIRDKAGRVLTLNGWNDSTRRLALEVEKWLMTEVPKRHKIIYKRIGRTTRFAISLRYIQKIRFRQEEDMIMFILVFSNVLRFSDS